MHVHPPHKDYFPARTQPLRVHALFFCVQAGHNSNYTTMAVKLLYIRAQLMTNIRCRSYYLHGLHLTQREELKIVRFS